MRAALGLVLLLSACSSPTPTAADVCAKLKAAGVGTGCKATVPSVINARARDEYVFDLPAPKGKTGHVLTFAKDDDYDATVKAYEGMAMLVGSHRYGSPKARVFVQLNSEASLDLGKKAKGVVDAL